MSFNIALTGIAAAQKDLDVTANNIANVNTTGFKESRAEFADVYASSVFTSGKTKAGDGVQTTSVSQQFHQGSTLGTKNSLDLAIGGDGYFALSSELGSQDQTFTRAGAFKLNKDNFIVDSQGNFLQGFPVDAVSGDATSVSLSTSTAIQIPDSSGSPRATTNVYSSFRLDSTKAPPSITPFDPTQTGSFTHSTSTNVYDSLGEAHTMQLYFVKTDSTVTGNANEWQTFATLDGQPFNPDGSAQPTAPYNPISTFQFDANGIPLNTNGALNTGNTFNPVTLTGANISGLLSNGASFPNNVTINWRDEAGTSSKIPTQHAGAFENKVLDQDGAAVGRLANIDIGVDGKIVASYSNGDSTYLGQVALTRFSNSQGLQQVGNTSWKKSLTSGEPIAGEANSGAFGKINSSALEQSNVNLTNELVDLISAQRNFQANSRALEVNSTLQQAILQIR
ncbi:MULTISPECIES: flagellar hook protein FlgE [Pseudoalteromonas]|uniref:Flagellar hook protein FlgE n=1 Tax=Pseudoalteromonas aliena TaxID=247523 RepID=A0A1Q2GZH1_9GAMM|nr:MULTISPECIES: flagellar hook protein FlgE [Pseudoalteromonas]AQQ00520.1 flagellar hook protein FlgE [Pseudoalteromonas aliena]MBB1386402.1 flagellar hook protein FlgE [Pseudoalteromonas sp. SG45-5]MBB1394367.1 flagellar hook protein FlgE [Pseudoalteromonas sp. SG44-4]MBB1446284.1 flagellar hook protein FlgE [Pseudoalteromonas sp. SG41-6]